MCMPVIASECPEVVKTNVALNPDTVTEMLIFVANFLTARCVVRLTKTTMLNSHLSLMSADSFNRFVLILARTLNGLRSRLQPVEGLSAASAVIDLQRYEK